MAAPKHAQALIDKLRDLPDEKVSEVEDFIDFLRDRQVRAPQTAGERLQAAVAAGHITAPEADRSRTSVARVPPAVVPGVPPSEIVLQDRR